MYKAYSNLSSTTAQHHIQLQEHGGIEPSQQ